MTMTQRNEMMVAEATRYNTTVENLIESGFVFLSDACGTCHWFAPEPAFGGTMMSLAWYREQQANFRREHGFA